jgi:NAD(P)-dependent dehydrogenase (short-subunit alcohol dehydrogenase family)
MEYQDRQVVVTGGTGALGTAVVGALLEAGAVCVRYLRPRRSGIHGYRARLRSTGWPAGAGFLRVLRTSGAGLRGMNCDRIACRKGHFECLVKTSVERQFGLGFLVHATWSL